MSSGPVKYEKSKPSSSRSWQPHARKRAVLRGLDAIFALAQSTDNFSLFGNDIIQCFYDVASVTTDPVRARALMYVEQLAQRWKHSVRDSGWKQGVRPTAQEVMDVIIGIYCMERVGIGTTVKPEVQRMMAGPDSPTSLDYLGWDPFKGGPPRSLPDIHSGENVSRFRTMSNSLIHTFYAERVSLSLGVSYAQVFPWLRELQPYQDPERLPWDEYIDQCYLITHIVFTLNNWGELRLDPALLPHEYYFIREHLPVHIKSRDVHLVGEFVECLRAFGASDTDALVQAGMEFLMVEQGSDDLWDSDSDAYTCYHATMVAVQALLAHEYRGFGPSNQEIGPMLVGWYHEATGGKQAERPSNGSAGRDVLQNHSRDAAAADSVSSGAISFPDNEPKMPSWSADLRLSKMRRCADQLCVAPAAVARRSSPPAVNTVETIVAPRKSIPAVDMGNKAAAQAKREPSPKASPPPPSVAVGSNTAASDENSGGSTAGSQLVKEIQEITTQFEKIEEDKAWGSAGALLTAVGFMPITIEVLQATTLGKTVNRLKKAPDDAVASKARSLVTKWKGLVRDRSGG